MNDIAILKEMLTNGVLVPLKHTTGKLSVLLKDKQANTSIEISDIPNESIVIRVELFKPPTIFKPQKGLRKRADFIIVSNTQTGKWIICIETQKGTGKDPDEVEQQLRGAECFIGYCKCVGKSFWLSTAFLDGYQFRYVSIVNINIDKQITRVDKTKIRSGRSPDTFREISGPQTLLFDELI